MFYSFREFQVLFKDVTEAFGRAGVSPHKDTDADQQQGDAEVMDISISTDEVNITTWGRVFHQIINGQALQTQKNWTQLDLRFCKNEGQKE